MRVISKRADQDLHFVYYIIRCSASRILQVEKDIVRTDVRTYGCNQLETLPANESLKLIIIS